MEHNEIYQPIVPRRSRMLSVRGVECCVYEWGEPDAPLIFYLHGWGDTGSTFQFVVDSLKADWRVVAPDWRGFGRTRARSEAYWFPDYLADLHALLQECAPDSAVNLIGHSMGGNVAALYAGIMPDRVAALINMEGFGLADADPCEAPARYRKWLEAGVDKPDFRSYANFDALASKIRKRSPLLSEARAHFIAREWAQPDNGVIRLRADPAHKLPNAILYRRAEAEACWQNIQAKTLLISGEKSPFSQQSEDLQALPFANARQVSIAGVGHMMQFEAPQLLAIEIEKFLRKPL